MEFEEIEVFKQYKVAQYRRILNKMINFKYQISLQKGIKMFFEALILVTMMFGVVHKANIYSIFYFIFIIRLITAVNNEKTMSRNIYYLACVKRISLLLLVQYLLYLLNLTSSISPRNFPDRLKGYPGTKNDITG